jgi:TM2 domain-containing membrane protein YozV
MPYAPKTKMAAGLLAIFLGSLGIHNFYLGRTGVGVAQLLICVLGGFIIIGPFIAWIWAIVEAILIFTGSMKDGQGNPLQ